MAYVLFMTKCAVLMSRTITAIFTPQGQRSLHCGVHKVSNEKGA